MKHYHDESYQRECHREYDNHCIKLYGSVRTFNLSEQIAICHQLKTETLEYYSAMGGGDYDREFNEEFKEAIRVVLLERLLICP